MDEARNACKTLAGKTQGMFPFQKVKSEMETGVEMGLEYVGRLGNVDWTKQFGLESVAAIPVQEW